MKEPRMTEEEALFTTRMILIPFVGAIAAVVIALIVDYVRKG